MPHAQHYNGQSWQTRIGFPSGVNRDQTQLKEVIITGKSMFITAADEPEQLRSKHSADGLLLFSLLWTLKSQYTDS